MDPFKPTPSSLWSHYRPARAWVRMHCTCAEPHLYAPNVPVPVSERRIVRNIGVVLSVSIVYFAGSKLYSLGSKAVSKTSPPAPSE